MFIKDGLGNLERTSIYLSRPSGELLGCLDEYIDEESASMLRGLNQQQQLSFDLNKQDDCWYEYVQEGMYLFVEGVGLFKMQQPKINIDGTHEVKNVTANSCDSELEEKNINLEINMGTKTSQEFLVPYHEIDKGEQLVNPYTGVPYDWLVLYNTFPEQLTAHLATYNSGYFGSPNTDIVVTEKTKIDILNDLFALIPRLKSKFDKVVDAETDETNYKLIEFADVTYNEYNGQIASITLYADYAKRVRYLIDFYTRNREALSLLSVVLEKTDGLWSVGDIYGVSDGDYSLANKKYQFETSENIYSFLTTSLAQATNCMAVFDIVNRKVNIVPVENIGKDTGIVISYDNLLHSLNIEATEDNLSTRLIVTGADDLNIEQVNFGLDYIDDLSYKMNAVDENNHRIYVTDALAAKYKNYVNSRENLRTEYIQGSKDYRKYTEQIDEIKNRVPLDDLKTDWGTFSEEELQASLTAYKNLLASLISLYRSEYYPQGLNEDDSVNEDFMATTVYWNDYKAYQNVIVEIECAISTFPYYSDHDKWSDYNKLRYEDAIKAWETEWYLYGSDELQAKIASYKNNMDTLAESAVIRTAPDEDTIKTWEQLTDAEKTDFGNISDNYKYDLYMSYYNNMVSAQTYLATLLEQISDLEDARTAVQERRVEIVQLVALENNFTVDECKVLSSLFREADCSNDNILVTNIDSAEQKIDKMSELLEYGQEQLSIMSRPQLTFTISSDNLLGLTGFEDFWKDFEVGNYLLVQYRDDTYIKLRMVGYQYNPCLPSNNQLTITFSNIIRSKVGVTDLESLLGLSSSSSGRSGSGSSGGSGGNYGESDDIDITISNTMLAKLLNSELFGTRVQDVILNTIDVNAITARYATFDGLASGVTIIDGQCITTGWIVSLDYNGTTPGSVNNTAGSILNLNTGYFNFGGGRIKFDGSSLVVEGNIIATTLATGGRTSASTGHDGMYVDAQGNIYSGSTNGVIIYKDGKFNLANGKIVYNGTTTTIASDVIIGSNTVAQAWTDIQTAQTTADGKSKIYYGQPTVVIPPTYDELNEGDYLVDDTTGSTYRWSDGDQAWVLATDYASAIEAAVEEIEEELIPQIDGKIETWAQQTNPKTWSADVDAKHDGDLWYYTGVSTLTVDGVSILPSKTYKYSHSTGKWSLYQTPNKSLFDLADSKKKIFYGTTSGTYQDVEENDYLVDSTTGCTYRYYNSAWVKVTDYASADSVLEQSLKAQIDAKIETWAQDTNPATAWNTADLKAEHDGDLWYYIGLSNLTIDNVTIEPSKAYEYQYNSSTQTGVWSEYHSPSRSLFDLVDGKSTIFYGTPSGTYSNVETGDYLVDDTDGCSYRWTGLAWTKVTDYASSVAALEQSLEEQIDAKIETWAKSSDPAASWTTDEYEEHSNDLWLYTGLTDLLLGSITIHPQGIYKFVPLTSTAILDESGAQITDESGNNLVTEHTYQWAEYSSVSSNVFDMADGKSTIYYGLTSGSYPNVEVGDYLVDPTDGSTYKWDGVLWANVTNYSESLDTAIHALQDTLEKQIDGKVETWAQLSDPSANWTEDEQPQHNGDLWFYTGTVDSAVKDSTNVAIKPSKTYQYNSTTNKWVLYDSPSRSLFDFADGKATVFYGSTSQTFTPTPEEGDYLVDNTDSDTAGCTYRRTANNTWEKVTDYKAYTNSAIGVAKEDLENQIDAKVETWAQSTNPALSWSSSDIVAHNGDLWLYTGSTDLVIAGVTIHPQGIYKFACSANSEATLDESGNALLDESGTAIQNEISYSWNAYSSTSSNIFDLTDGKSTIFYGSTSNTYPGVAEGDYLVNNQNGTTYRYTGGQWVAVTKTGSLYGTCSSVATAKEKVVTCNESISVYEGLTISVKFANANTYYSDTMPLTLNIGKLGTKNVYYNGDLISSTNRMYWAAGATIMFMYDGNGWIVIGHPESYNGSCSTGASTAAKNCLIVDAVVVKGTVVNITFTNTNSASSPTLNVIDNTTNAPTIVVDGSNNTLSSSSQYNWNDGACVGFTFDGQRWRLNDSSSLYNTNSYMRFESTGTAQGLMIANMRGGVVSNSAITAPNTLLTSTELLIRNGQIVLARFGTTIILGVETASHTVIQTDGMHIYASNGTTQIAHLGYGSGNDVSGTSPAPYYTFGVRNGSSSGDIGNYSVSEGYNTKASGFSSHAEGYGTTATGSSSHAQGDSVGRGIAATGNGAFALGQDTSRPNSSYTYGIKAQGVGSIAGGYVQNKGAIIASGGGSVAYGYVYDGSIIADSSGSIALGYECEAHASGAIALGWGAKTGTINGSVAVGRFNSSTDKYFVVGKGTGDTTRSDALTVDGSGNVSIAGTLTQGSDRRFKDHLRYLGDDAEEFIRNLKPAYYKKDEQYHVGFYAQDVEAIDNWHCMIGEMNGFKTLGYLEMIAPLVAYCQALERRIEDLERN